MVASFRRDNVPEPTRRAYDISAFGKIVAKNSEDVQKEMIVYANIIAQESIGGWYLVSTMPVTVATTKKRFKGSEMPYNVLVFARDRVEEVLPQ